MIQSAVQLPVLVYIFYTESYCQTCVVHLDKTNKLVATLTVDGRVHVLYNLPLLFLL